MVSVLICDRRSVASDDDGWGAKWQPFFTAGRSRPQGRGTSHMPQHQFATPRVVYLGLAPVAKAARGGPPSGPVRAPERRTPRPRRVSTRAVAR